MRSFFLFSTSLICFSAFADETVLLAILARNKAHLLPHYLKCIEALDYDKRAITVYINTNNNEDATQTLLEAWAAKNRSRYRKIILEAKDQPDLPCTKPHVWIPIRFRALGEIRNRSLAMAKRHNCAFYFVADCDNFITPCTLKYLVEKRLPIIAPMLTAIPIPGDSYSNFVCAINNRGYEEKHPDYRKILKREIVGTFEVPIVHCTYLIQSDSIDFLGYRDQTPHHEFVVFSRIARNNGIGQFICNERDFGVLLHHGRKLTLSEECADFARLVLTGKL